MVSHSTPQSREAKEVSKLAIFETIFFTVLVLAFTIYTDTTTYLLSSIIIAPFLLLKTPRSIALSHKMFLYKRKIDENSPFYSLWEMLHISVIVLITFYITHFLIDYFHLGGAGFRDFGYGILIGIILSSVSIAISIISGIFAYVGFYVFFTPIARIVFIGLNASIIPMILIEMHLTIVSFGVFIGIHVGIFLSASIGIGLGFLIRSLIVKFISTWYSVVIELFINPVEFFENIVRNYHEQLFVNDSFYAPELLPNISKVDIIFSLSSYLTSKGDAEKKILKIFIIPIWSLAYLYRWSIKSTAWFYFPLVFLANTTQKMRDDKTVKKDMDIQTNSIKLWFNLGVVVFLFISWFGMVFKDKIVELLEWSKSIYALFDILKGLKLPIVVDSWSVYLVTVSTFIYFVVYYFVDRQQSHIEKGNEGYSKTVNKILFWTIRVHLVLWMVAFGLTLYSSYILYHEMLRDNILSLFNL
jgi:hypothetical protein